MCTLVLLHQVNDRYPLIVAANRDEAYDRPSEGPDYLQITPTSIIAPKDLRGGGTWIGAAEGGWFSGLTNQDEGDLLLDKESRGHVVRFLLLTGEHRSAVRFLASINPKDYNSFNVVFGRAGALFLCKVHRDRPLSFETIPPGVTVVANDCGPERCYARREARCTEAAMKVTRDDDAEAVVDKLEAMLKIHDAIDPYQGVCVHDDERQFGTKSSSVILFSPEGDVDYYHCDEHPCVSAGLSLRQHIMALDLDGLEAQALAWSRKSPQSIP